MSSISVAKMREKIQQFPRVHLAELPTPLCKLENLSREFGGPELFIKRDDLTGLAFGGNKSRKLEFIISDVLAKKADVIITWASVQSNWCLQTAAAARKFGIFPILILFKTYDLPDEYDGNLVLDHILGADIRIKEAENRKMVSKEEVQNAIDEIIVGVEKKGYTSYVVPSGGSMIGGSMEIPLGAISYTNAFVELLAQAEAQGIKFNYVILATGSGGMQSGLVVGSKALGNDIKILGMSVSEKRDACAEQVLKISRDTQCSLDIDLGIKQDDILVFDDYIKEGYGIVDKEVAQILRLVAQKEGIFLDPIYTGKAMLGLVDLINKGFFTKDDKVVFFHTGGTAALFPYKQKFCEFLSSPTP